MRAIILDIDMKLLEVSIPTLSENEVYLCIELYLEEYGFTREKDLIYFGDETVTPVTCVLAIQGLSNKYPWFQRVVKSIKMLKIDENDDLLPAIKPIKKRISQRFHVVS